MGTYYNARAGRAPRGTPTPAACPRAWLPLLLCRLGLLLCCAGALAAAPPAETETAPPGINILPGDGMNLQLVEQINPHYVVVKVDPPVHNWFAGTLTDLPTDGEVTIGLSMQGMDTKGNKANVSKWRGLRPVMTYGDPTQYETYEWFRKDEQGRWVSGDPFKQDEAKFAGTGTVPAQTAIPAELAAQFLSKDGKYWQPWREVDTAEAVTSLNIFRMKQRFARSTATVAMRVPYTYTYLQHFLARLQAAQLPGVTVDEIGETPGGRKLQVIRSNNPSYQRGKDGRTVLVVAREHATEHDSSWVVFGVMNSVLTSVAQDFRNNNLIWLFVPILDIDGSVNCQFDRITDQFRSKMIDKPVEVDMYINYLLSIIQHVHTIDVVINFHNIESNEFGGTTIMCPFVSSDKSKDVIEFNQTYFSRLAKENYIVGDASFYLGSGLLPFRISSWCATHFNTFDLYFETNSRNPRSILSIQKVSGLGNVLSDHIQQWLWSKAGVAWHIRSLRAVLRSTDMHPPDAHNRIQLQFTSGGYQ